MDQDQPTFAAAALARQTGGSRGEFFFSFVNGNIATYLQKWLISRVIYKYSSSAEPERVSHRHMLCLHGHNPDVTENPEGSIGTGG